MFELFYIFHIFDNFLNFLKKSVIFWHLTMLTLLDNFDFWQFDKRHLKTPSKYNPTSKLRENTDRAILESSDYWDIDYISDNWEQQSQHS